tara:strand:- start:36 stop:269 length:234 start_codon:yes stop_codon:yes gene_type:complete
MDSSTFFALVVCALFFVAIAKGHPWPIIYITVLMDVGFIGVIMMGWVGLIIMFVIGIPLVAANVMAFGHLTKSNKKL